MSEDKASFKTNAESKYRQATAEAKHSGAKRKSKEKSRSGVIYLSSVPEYMSVQKLRNIFSEYGEVGRTFFQPVGKCSKYDMAVSIKIS